MINKKYQIIYADPPWSYEHPISDSRKIENQYPTMDLEEIKEIEVPSDDDCILFLWATAPKLTEAIEVMKAWGFKYRSCMIWDKMVMGMGYWFRNRHEMLLVGIKGDVHPPEPTKRKESVLQIKRGKHSSKPSIFRTLITEWYPDKDKIELFARCKFEGWNAWGNEVPKEEQKILRV